MQTPILEDIIEACEDLEFKASTRIYGMFGQYQPDKDRVLYNPKMIGNEEEFIVTILHELVHHIDLDGELSELETELEAERLMAEPEIKNHIQTYFWKEIKRYWKK